MARLHLRTRLGYGVGHVLNDLCSSLWFTYLLIFLNKVERFPNTLAGVVLLIGQIADGLATPFVGHQADRTDDTAFCVKYGRRKTWHLVGTLCVMAAFPFIFMGCLGCTLSEAGYQVVYFAPFVVIFQFGWAAVQISHLALIPALTSDPHERTELNAIRYAFTVFSNITVYIITWLILGFNSTALVIGPSDANTFRIIVASAVALGAVFSFIFHLTVREDNRRSTYAPLPTSDPALQDAGAAHDDSFQGNFGASDNSHQYVDVRTTMKARDWFRERQFYLVAVLYMCTRLFCNLSQAYVPIYLQDTLVLTPQSVAYIPLTMYVAGFLTTVAIKPVNRKFGRKISFLLGCLLAVSGCVWINFGHSDLYKQRLIYLVAALLGAGGSTMLVTSLSITADLIGNNVESGAFVYGAMSFVDKLSNGAAIMLIQWYSPYSPICPHCLQYYRYILTYVCGGACVAGSAAALLLVTAVVRTRSSSDSSGGGGGRDVGGGRDCGGGSDGGTAAHVTDSPSSPLLRNGGGAAAVQRYGAAGLSSSATALDA